MKSKNPYLLILFILITLACSLNSGSPAASPSPEPADTSTSISAPETFTPIPALTFTSTPPPTETVAFTPISTVPSLRAKVTADLLSCRYGPGPEYLYLFALRQTANIRLVGRVDADNWNWVLVENTIKCWVNAEFLEIQGDLMTLPIVYPGIAKLPVSPYYPAIAVLSATREGNKVTVSWMDIPLIAGDEEDASMQHYIIEVWRCEGGQIIFDPLATNFLAISFVDEPGCTEPSHGRVFVQEKHGYAGPAEIPWPTP